MSIQYHGRMAFPTYTGARCYMMPFIQGRAESLPKAYASYADVVERFALPGQEGQIGLITIDESMVEAGRSQRGYGAGDRTIHTEACISGERLSWGPASPTWGPSPWVRLARDTRVLIANSIADTCMVWDQDIEDTTPDGDLSPRSAEFPRSAGRMMDAGEVLEIGIFTPHEPIRQQHAGPRQFFRIVGTGVEGRESYFTENPQVPLH
ncbi:hypothetical protein KUV57_11835 [Epibacterium sp. DP7N7-1]|nr:hypothetical protein [Epibacterium sp. DP7N7-1]